MTYALGHLLKVAVGAARAAGNHALSHRDRREEVASREHHDVKLLLDAESQGEAEKVLREGAPGIPVFGEEGRDGAAIGDDAVWVVDPIDGTVSFMHGLPFWCSSVALRQQGQQTVGVVYLPVLGECYTATSEEPSRCNGKPIGVSGVETLDRTLLLTGISKHVKDDDSFARFRRITEAVQKVRVMGAAAGDICMVAAGRADAYYESGINIWDWAAGELIVRQAGGRVEVLELGDGMGTRLVCTNGHVHDDVLALVK